MGSIQSFAPWTAQMSCLCQGLQTFPNCMILCWLSSNICWHAWGLDSIFEIVWICECDVTSVAWFWSAANFGWRMFLKINLGRVLRRRPHPFLLCGSGRSTLEILCSGASRVCIIWMAEGWFWKPWIIVGGLIPDSLHASARHYLQPRWVSYTAGVIRVLLQFRSYMLVESQIWRPKKRFAFDSMHPESAMRLILCTQRALCVRFYAPRERYAFDSMHPESAMRLILCTQRALCVLHPRPSLR
jgi:hypothetical protein